MANKYIMISMEDESAKHLADVLSNKTAKKIIDLLAEKELSENDIAKELEIPINTAEYNIQKLVKAGLVEHSKSFFWSVKGKKIPVYRISNKSIVISPKKRTNIGLFAALIISGIAAAAIRGYEITKTIPAAMTAEEKILTSAPMTAANNTGAIAASAPNLGSIALWFLGGALFSLVIYLIYQKIVRRSN
jgi:predicted transcriptional regulator